MQTQTLHRTLSAVLILVLASTLCTAGTPRMVSAQFARAPLDLSWSAAQAASTNAVAWADIDNDGDLDLAVGNNGTTIQIYRNTGGNLEDVPAWSVPLHADVRSLAWGDVDNDGALELVVGSYGSPVKLYKNNGGTLSPTPAWTASIAESTTSVAWGDMNNDGYLDLAVGNDGQPLCIYQNTSGTLSPTPTWSSINTDRVTSVAWGDVNNDGYLDLAVGASGYSRLYNNIGGVFDPTVAWSSPFDFSNSVAWGDVDNDGYLDLAVGNGSLIGYSNRLYKNNGGTLSTTPVWSSTETDATTSIAWGDVNNDGYLDLAVGNRGLNGEPNRIYENVHGVLSTTATWSSAETDSTNSIAWGDVDGDGSLDLAVGNSSISRVYHNQLGVLPTTASSTLAVADKTQRIALGDMNGDGRLDLAVGNYREPSHVYLNVGGSFISTPDWSSPNGLRTTSIAWGDVDGDGTLDLAIGNNYQPVQVYRNEGGTLSAAPIWSSDEISNTTSLAWGDMNGDGDLDLAVGTSGEPNRVYLNHSGQLSTSATWTPTAAENTTSVVWGDVDNDGDLDLAVGNGGTPSRIYRNDGGTLTRVPVWSSGWSDYTTSIAWGDVDGDGDLDLAVGNDQQPNRLYRNDGGTLTSGSAWITIEGDSTTSVAWGDVDGDGDLDLAVGNNFVQPSRIYLNEGGFLSKSASWTSAELVGQGWTNDLAWGDLNGDGSLDLVTGTDSTSTNETKKIYLNQRNRTDGIATIPSVQVTRPGTTGDADHYAVATVLEGPTITIPYVLRHPQSLPVRTISVAYSLDGGGSWQSAVPATGTQTTDLATSPTGTAHSFNWDVYASGVMGRQDNVVVRVIAQPDIRTPAGKTPGPFFFSAFAASTNPFRVRGSQVRVMQDGQPVAGAIVYQASAGQSTLTPYASLDGQPFRTDGQGYLQGSGVISTTNRLIATVPISSTSAYTLYNTSAAPTTDGLDSTVVQTLGVQMLSVTSTNRLILFNLALSLEWDARGDERFLSQLRFNLQRASDLLFDWTDGHAALGQVTIYHNAAHWDDVQVRIYATNRLRPNANQGGIVSQSVTDPMVPSVTYAPGQVRIGAIWNRYGESSGNLGEDWPRAFAHELGHFLFFLDDNYLGLDANGRLISVTTCPSAMTDPYRDDYSEFHPDADWPRDCGSTLSQHSTGRSDWATIKVFYNFAGLSAPQTFNANPGPHTLPLAVTQIHEVDPGTPSTTLAAPIFSLTYNGGYVLPTSAARAFLFGSNNNRLIDLGSPTLDQVTARGAHSGDMLCVYDLGSRRLGCQQLDSLTSQIPLADHPDWLPEIIVTPVNSSTLTLDVKGVPGGLNLQARVFPLSGTTTDPISLDPVTGGYRTQVTLSKPSLGGYIQIWVEGDPQQSRREAVVDYMLGGSPGMKYGRNAPSISADGQTVIYGNKLNFQKGEFFTLQSTGMIPPPPPGRTQVGQGYWLSASANAPELTQASISISYMSRDVSAAEESGIEIYYWNGQQWTALDTTLSVDRNEASAFICGPGLYALMSSYRVPISNIGWNLIAYPVPGTRVITDALTSILGLYTTVYGYDPTDTDHWKVFDVNAPSWVNDLTMLDFGKGYWIRATTQATLYIQGTPSQTSTLALASSVPTPPATYYGTLQPSPSYTPKTGVTVEAWIGNTVCGKSQTRLVGGHVIYSVAVSAAGEEGLASCGTQGRTVSIHIEMLTLTTLWDNSQVWNMETHWAYLPQVLR